MRLREGPASDDETALADAQQDYTAVRGLLRARGGKGGEGTEEMRTGLGKHECSLSGLSCQTHFLMLADPAREHRPGGRRRKPDQGPLQY